MSLSKFGLLIGDMLDLMMFKERATSFEPILSSVLHEHISENRMQRVLLTAYLKDGSAFRMTIERV